jgi:hypothetical protein
MKAKAVAFAENVLQDDDKGADLQAESPESYAQRKRIVITENPQQRRRVAVANANDSMTKAELQDHRQRHHHRARQGNHV